MSSRIRLMIADDHAVVREGLVALFGRHDDLDVVAEAADSEQAIGLFKMLRPDVSVVDIRLPPRSGIDVIHSIRRVDPDARCLVLTSAEGDAVLRQALAAGAIGFLLKGATGAEVVTAVRNVAEGQQWLGAEARQVLDSHFGPELTQRELDVLALVTEGLRNKEISQRLNIAENTVKVHVQSVMGKLGARDRTEAAVIAIRRGLLLR